MRPRDPEFFRNADSMVWLRMAQEELTHTREEFVVRATLDRQASAEPDTEPGAEGDAPNPKPLEIDQQNYAYFDAAADVDRAFSRWLSEQELAIESGVNYDMCKEKDYTTGEAEARAVVEEKLVEMETVFVEPDSLFEPSGSERRVDEALRALNTKLKQRRMVFYLSYKRMEAGLTRDFPPDQGFLSNYFVAFMAQVVQRTMQQSSAVVAEIEATAARETRAY